MARRAPSLKVELRLLGPLEVLKGTAGVRVGGPKPRALLALLALDIDRAVSVDRLVEELWPATPPESAPHAIQVYVSQLRKVLGDTVVREGLGYCLRLAPEAVDVHRFERLATVGHDELAGGNAAAASSTLREALALWRGPALADFAYEPFAQTAIARLEDVRFAALEDRIDADLALGRHAELVSEIEALVEAQPLRERPRALLMRALYLAGRQADALATYRDARTTLVEELGIEPGPALRELEAAILRQDESLRPSDAPLTRPAMQRRRLATILVAELLDSMALADALDAEALGAVQRRYLDVVSAAVVRHGGTVERYGGDAVTATFGVPIAHEDDALRAARAAVEIRAGIAALNVELEQSHRVELAVRIGLAAGEVVATETDSGQRFLAGDAIGVAGRLQQEAAPGEILVGEIAARLVAHAARLEPLGQLDVSGRKTAIEMFRLVEVSPVAPGLASRLDARFVGRKRELSGLRKSLRSAVADGKPRTVLVTGAPGVGKSRLAAEAARRTRGRTVLWGRCLSYGDGITYWPIREMLAQAPVSAERDTVIDALGAEPPPPAAESALLFRRFCEASAQAKPLVVVFDDVHWAEPTLLELVEHLTDRGDGPILILCLAREELLEDRPSFLEPSARAERVELAGLTADETDSLLDQLGGPVLDAKQRARLVEAADGNPLFLEQLLELAREGGLGEQALPETVQALLAARLERLGPGERAVLERGAVVGKEFGLKDVVALLDPAAAPTADAHLRTLVERRFLRPRDGVFSFRHVLLLEAVYRAAPKRLRAELHERFADRLDEAYPTLPELDELVGYHLEQAYLLRTELGEADRGTAQLGEQAGHRLGEAGFRALKRGDMPATVGLLSRAIARLPRTDEARQELMCELGIAQYSAGSVAEGNATYAEAVADAAAGGHRRVELRARLEEAYGRLLAEPQGGAQELLDLAEDAVPTFEALRDDRSLSRAWLLIGYVRGGIYGDHTAWEEAEERALEHYRRTGFPPATCLQQIAAAVYWGPTPVPQGISRCAGLLADDTSGAFGRASVLPFLGGLHAQRGDYPRARALVDEAEDVFGELGSATAAVILCGTVRADIELLAGDLDAAERTLREQCGRLERTQDRSHYAVRAAKLAETLYRQGRLDDADGWATVARANAATDDRSVELVLAPVEAKLLARKGDLRRAREVAEAAVRLADETDGLNLIGSARIALAEVLRMADRKEDADRAIEDALRLFERKGNLVAAADARRLLEAPAPA